MKKKTRIGFLWPKSTELKKKGGGYEKREKG